MAGHARMAPRSENHYRGPASGMLSAPGRGRGTFPVIPRALIRFIQLTAGDARPGPDHQCSADRERGAIRSRSWPHSGVSRAVPFALATQAELLDQRAVAVDVLAGKVLQQAPAAPDEQQ